MTGISCPRCQEMNQKGELLCRVCSARMHSDYVDCYTCGGSGTITLAYTPEYATKADDMADRALPCPTCLGKKKLRAEGVRSATTRTNLLRLLPELLDLVLYRIFY